ncbi:MAG TPA: glycogen synthase, partial [Elusimicrobiota bacterium]|nr:glycogen synthase [Elusimicrobiota bacterium]
MRIAFVASEAVPFAKTGGLADVVGALAAQMAARGHEVRLYVPAYPCALRAAGETEPGPELAVPIGASPARGRFLRSRVGGVEARLLECPAYFGRPGLYQEAGRDYPDNAERFAFFCRAVLEDCRAPGAAPDVFHCHDWQTGLVPALLAAGRDGALAGSSSVFTIHNLAYQGNFPAAAFAVTGLPAAAFSPAGLEYHGNVGYLKAGLVYADGLSTVSPEYAREIQTEELGMGMDGVLRGRAGSLRGILNGLDVDAWDPARDAALLRRYGPRDWEEGKKACKRELQGECALEQNVGELLIGAVARLDPQKGLDLGLQVLPEALARGAQFVLVGQGRPDLERAFEDFAHANPRNVHFHTGFDDGFARRVYAAADLFLMPSRFEPCGLGQLIAMRYGALPLATRTGGLADTVRERASAAGPANGFLGERAVPAPLAAALARA